MGDWARRVAMLVGIGTLIGYGSSIGSEWGVRRANIDHMNAAVAAMTSDVAAMRRDVTDEMTAMRKDVADDMAAIRKDVASAMIAIGNIKGRIHGATLPWASRAFASTEPNLQEDEQ